MKYIDAEKLIAEIERLQKRAKHYEEISLTCGEGSYWSGEDGAFELLITFITSLQQEQPEVDLEKEIQDWCKENVTGVRPIYTADSLIYGLLPKTARHFYELGRARKG